MHVLDVSREDLNSLAMFLFRQNGVFCSVPDTAPDHSAVQAVFGDLWERYTVAELKALLVNLTSLEGGEAS